MTLFWLPMCICEKALSLRKLKQFFPEFSDFLEKFYLRCYILDGLNVQLDLQLFQDLGGQLTETALEKLLEVDLEGLITCRQFCEPRHNDAQFQLSCGCKAHLPCLLSRIQQGSSQCDGSTWNYMWTHEDRKQFT